MLQIIINQIGPIDSIELKLNKFNVLIGPQSSGKSTIAKIISFCLWLEKDVLLHRSGSYVNFDFVEKQLLEFHKLKNYLNEGYLILFHSDTIHFQYNKDICSVELRDEFEQSKIGKVAYIPAERNAVTLPNITSLKMPENSTRSFIFDWLEIHQKFQKQNAIDLLNLRLKYYYEETSQKDMIVLENGKEIMLEEASSGLQSVVPLYVYIHYLTHWVYEHQEDISFDKKEKIEKILREELLKIITANIPNPELSRRTIDLFLMDVNNQKLAKNFLETGRKLKESGGTNEIINTISNLEENISHPHYSNIILEEPELNLFPETQKDLMYDMLAMINNNRDRMIITTHSPYLLYALNNCMLGYLVHDHIPIEETELQFVQDSMIDPKDVSVWEIREGKFAAYKENPNHTIQDSQGLIRTNYFDRIMKNIMADFSSLMDYCDEN